MTDYREVKFAVEHRVLPRPFNLSDIHELRIETRDKEDIQNIRKLIEEYFNGRG